MGGGRWPGRESFTLWRRCLVRKWQRIPGPSVWSGQHGGNGVLKQAWCWGKSNSDPTYYATLERQRFLICINLRVNRICGLGTSCTFRLLCLVWKMDKIADRVCGYWSWPLLLSMDLSVGVEMHALNHVSATLQEGFAATRTSCWEQWWGLALLAVLIWKDATHSQLRKKDWGMGNGSSS